MSKFHSIRNAYNPFDLVKCLKITEISNHKMSHSKKNLVIYLNSLPKFRIVKFFNVFKFFIKNALNLINSLIMYIML